MVEYLHSVDSTHTRYVISPNRAMSWELQITLYLLISIVTLTIGVVFLFIGYPLILPFAGVELLLLGFALYATTRQAQRQEVITIKPELVVIETGRNAPEHSYEFHREWLAVDLIKPPYKTHPSRLVVRSAGRQMEIGGFLNEEERQGLATELKKALLKGQ